MLARRNKHPSDTEQWSMSINNSKEEKKISERTTTTGCIHRGKALFKLQGFHKKYESQSVNFDVIIVAAHTN